MHPVDFLKKHIIAKLVAEGFSEAVAKGGATRALSNTGACRNRAKRAPLLMTASVTPVSGLSVRQQQRSVRRARKNPEERQLNRVCFDFLPCVFFETTSGVIP